MVRIVKEDPTKKFSSKAITVLNLLGMVIADHPDRVKRLLAKHHIKTSSQPSPNELTQLLIGGIEKYGKPFHEDIAKIILQKVGADSYDSFVPIGAIAGAVGSIANIFGQKSQRKMMQDQASAQTMASMMAYKAQQERAAQEAQNKRQEAQAKQKEHANKMAMMQTIGLVALLALIGFVAFSKMKRRNPQFIQSPIPTQ